MRRGILAGLCIGALVGGTAGATILTASEGHAHEAAQQTMPAIGSQSTLAGRQSMPATGSQSTPAPGYPSIT